MIPKQRHAFHLDEPLWKQFAYYWVDTPQLKFGYSWKEKRPVTQVVGERIWPTVLLVGVGTLFATADRLLHRRDRRLATQLDLRPGVDQHRHGPLLHAQLLGGDACHTVLRRDLTLVPRGQDGGPRGRLPELARAQLERPLALDPARGDLRHHLRRRVPPHHAQLADGSHEGGLRPDGARQGPLRRCGALASHGAQRAACPRSPSS